MVIIARTVILAAVLIVGSVWAVLVGPDALFRIAPHLVVGSLFLFIGAGFGYFTGYRDAMREPRYRRHGADVGRPE